MGEITVIVPVYKVEKYIRRCIDSILRQSFRDFQLVLVDDGSPDACPQICDSYAKLDGRVSVIHKQNGGLSDARNAGIDWAMEHGGEWLSFVDSDDYLHVDYLMTLYQTALKEAANLAVCDFVRVNDQEEIIEEKHDFFDFTTEDKRRLFECLRRNWRVVPAWNKLYHKDIFRQLRFAVGKIHEDSFAIHHILWNCGRVAFIPTGLYYYRQRSNSIMATETPRSKLDGLEALVEQYEFRQEHPELLLDVIPSIDYLYEAAQMRSSFDKQEILRFKQLKKRLCDVVFSRKENRSMKRFLSFYCTKFYCKTAALMKELK